jgi:hypothetical protein
MAGNRRNWIFGGYMEQVFIGVYPGFFECNTQDAMKTLIS